MTDRSNATGISGVERWRAWGRATAPLRHYRQIRLKQISSRPQLLRTTPCEEERQKSAGLSEYIVELRRCFLCVDLGIAPEIEPRPDHDSYLQSWLSVLAIDKRAIFQAAAHAQRAVYGRERMLKLRAGVIAIVATGGG